MQENVDAIRVNQWPHRVSKLEEGSVTFVPVPVTILRVIDGPGYVFEGDETPSGRFSEKTQEEYMGVAWWLQGEWDEAVGGRVAPIDPGFTAGSQVVAALSIRKGKRDKKFYNCIRIIAQSGSAQPPAAAQSKETGATVPQGGLDARSISIQRQVAFKDTSPVLAAIIQSPEQAVLTFEEITMAKTTWLRLLPLLAQLPTDDTLLGEQDDVEEVGDGNDMG